MVAVISAYNCVRSADPSSLRSVDHYEFTAEDLVKLEEFVKFYRKFHNHSILNDEEISKFVDFLDYFGVHHEFNEHSLEVLVEDDWGYEARPDRNYYAIASSFKCKECGAQVEPREKLCADCVAREELKRFDPVI